MQFEFF